MSNFDEKDHQRDTDGKFATKDSSDTAMRKLDINGNPIGNAAFMEQMREQARNEYKQEQMEKVKAEYKASVNNRLVEYINDVYTGKTNKSLIMAQPNAREINEIEKLTGIDTSNYTRVITVDTVRHIQKRHGKDGKADKSMSDIQDIARIEYILANFDSMEVVGYDEQMQNKDGSFGKRLLYKKRINGNYYVAETIADNKNKRLTIKTAYKSK